MYLNKTDIGELFKISLPTVAKLVAIKGFPKPVTIGKRDRWLRDEVIAYSLKRHK